MFCNCKQDGSFYFCISLFWEVFSLLTVSYFCIVLNKNSMSTEWYSLFKAIKKKKAGICVVYSTWIPLRCPELICTILRSLGLHGELLDPSCPVSSSSSWLYWSDICKRVSACIWLLSLLWSLLSENRSSEQNRCSC